MKMKPPLRTASDVEAVKRGLADGTIDAIASDHAPHSAEEKEVEFTEAAFGVIGLETTLAVAAAELVTGGVIDWPTLVARLTSGPAAALGLDGGTLAVGAPGDVTVIDPARRWTIDPEKFKSKSRNTPFAGRKVTGRAVGAIVAGEVKKWDP